MIRHVYKPSKREGGKRAFDRLYRGRYRLDGEGRIREVPLKTPDKQIAEQRLNKIILDEQREREGLLAPKAERDAAKRRYAAHVEDFIETRRSVGRDEKYVKELRKKLLRLGQECSWEYPKDVSALAFEAWRSRQIMVAKTLNEYHTAICGLLNWLEPRIGSNPLRFVQKVESRGSQKRERRAFAMDELQRLVAVSGSRGVVYLTAAFTGLRRGELLQLEWRDLHLDAERPFVNVRASISKNHKQAMLPLHTDLVKALGRMRTAETLPMDVLFRGLIPRMTVFRKDLEAAGIAYVDTKGEYADFHSLRKTFGTMLTLAGVPQRVVMELMRHSDMRLTAKTYTDAGMLPVDATITKLPSLNGAVNPAPQLAPQSLVQARPALSLVVRETEVPHFAGTRMNTRFERDLALPVTECPAVSESEEWCAMQGSNLRANAVFIRVRGRLTHK
jgi:integrase